MVEKCSKGVFKGSLHKSLVQVFKGFLDTRFLLRDLGTADTGARRQRSCPFESSKPGFNSF